MQKIFITSLNMYINNLARVSVSDVHNIAHINTIFLALLILVSWFLYESLALYLVNIHFTHFNRYTSRKTYYFPLKCYALGKMFSLSGNTKVYKYHRHFVNFVFRLDEFDQLFSLRPRYIDDRNVLSHTLA